MTPCSFPESQEPGNSQALPFRLNDSDWLLVWDENETTVTLMQTGTHSDIFG